MEGKPISELDIGNNQGTVNVVGGLTRRLSMKIAKIRNVHPKTNTVDLEWLWPIRGAADGVSVGRPYIGFRSGIHFVPEVGSIVLIGYAFNQMVMLSYLMPSDYNNLINNMPDDKGVTSRIRQMGVGEISLNSRQDSEIYLHEDVEIRDKNLDKITISPSDGSITIDSLIFKVKNEAGKITMGPVIRVVDSETKTITDDGKETTSSGGGNGLTELKIVIDEFSDGTLLGSSTNKAIAEITVGTLVDTEGLQVINSAGNRIIININVAGSNFKIDSKGNVNINDGNMLTPTSVPAIPIPSLTTTTGNTFFATAQQRAAREGDRVVIPVSLPTSSLKAHPDLFNKALFNIVQLQQIASMIMTPYGPCVAFIPGAPNARLVGEITQGSDSVFIGSLDKTAESKEVQDNSL